MDMSGNLKCVFRSNRVFGENVFTYGKKHFILDWEDCQEYLLNLIGLEINNYWSRFSCLLLTSPVATLDI